VDGVHDLGGLVGFGPVDVEPDEPVFHEKWEGRVFAIAGSLSLSGHLHGMRHAIERMDGVHYLSSSYYEHWLTAVATLLVESGVLDGDELRNRAGLFPLARPLADEPVPPELGHEPSASARFAGGDRVRVRNLHPFGHTRCPDYVRGCTGVVARVDPPAAVPELSTHRGDERPERIYSVRFDAGELWGESDETAVVHVDLYERYLEPAGE
jgi:nitrile hydratase